MSTPTPCSPPDFDALFAAHAGFVWRVLKRHGLPARELSDGVQEVFLVVHRRLPEFEGRSSVRTWIYAIAQRVAQSMRRKPDLAHQAMADIPERARAAGQHDALEHKQHLALLQMALLELNDDKREVFALYELEGMTMAEVAKSLGIPENTALYRLYGAREQVRIAVQRKLRPGRPKLRIAGGGTP